MRLDHHPDGATPIDDISGLRLSWVRTQEDLNRAEADNIRRAMSQYLSGRRQRIRKWLSPYGLLRMHYAMFGDVWDWAGRYRRSQTNLGALPWLIPDRLAQLCETSVALLSMNFNLTALERAVKLHHQLAVIHPFENGNGRVARLACDRYLRDQGHAPIAWPRDLAKDGKTRCTYLTAMRAADAGDDAPLLHLIARWTT